MKTPDPDITPTPPSAPQIRRMKFLVYGAFVITIVSGIFVAFDKYVKQLNMGHYREEPSLPSDGFARFELAGQKFQIPSRYMYTYYEARGNRWYSRDDIQSIGAALVFDVFLPDFNPYGPDVHADRMRRQNSHVSVSLADEKANPAGYSPDDLIKKEGDRLESKPSEVDGLTQYYHAPSKQTYYFQSHLEDKHFSMVCNDVSCKATVVYREHPRLRVIYRYRKFHIQEWRRINENVKAKISEFIVADFE